MPSPFPSSTARLPGVVKSIGPLDTIRSGLPSPLKSPFNAASALGTGLVRAFWNVPLPFPRNSATPPASELAAATSGLPSELKSATATEVSFPAAGKVFAALSVPSPFPSSTSRPFMSAAITSGLPSPFTSAIATAPGSTPAG